MSVAWVLAALRPAGPYPVLVLYGEQGSAKSTTAEGLRHLIDPHVIPLRAAPRTDEQLMVAAQNSWVLAYDNISDVRPWLSDTLCQVATGTGFGSRKLYTNDEEVGFRVSRPVLLNGIASEMVNRPDLLDRALVLELPNIPDTSRRTREDVWRDLEAVRPHFLGALLDAVVVGLRNLPNVHLEKLPRMADFVKWVESCGPALGWKQGEFAEACQQSRDDLDGQALGLWVVYPALCRLLKKHRVIESTVARLLEVLNGMRKQGEFHHSEWPGSAKALGSQLRRYKPNLRRFGIEVEHTGKGRAGCGVRITLKPGTKPPEVE
jgi:hypothetical protein